MILLPLKNPQVHGKGNVDRILHALSCPLERMQAQEAAGSRVVATSNGADDLYSYRRGDIPIFNFDDADRLLIRTLQELIEALRELKKQVRESLH